jgi:hypothetical protein
MEKEYVIYKGQRMTKGWPEKIEEAQTHPTVLIDGAQHLRIRYGEEAGCSAEGLPPCRDCGVEKGQLHVIMCEVEQCAACGRQAITCGCNYDDPDE